MTAAEMIVLIVMLDSEWILKFPLARRFMSGPARVEVEGKIHIIPNSRQREARACSWLFFISYIQL